MKKIAGMLSMVVSSWAIDLGDRMKLSLDFASGLEFYKYEEKSLMSISGPMYRADTSLNVLMDFFALQFEGYYGADINKNVYRGTLLTPDPTNANKIERSPYVAKSTDWYAGGNLKLGFSFLPRSVSVRSLAYAGIGYRFLRNHVIDNPGIRAAYQRDQDYLYVPVGANIDIPVTNVLILSGMAEYRFFLGGKNKSYLSRLGHDNDLNFTQKSGYGLKLAFAMKFKLYKTLSAYLGVYYDYWFVDASDRQILRKNGAKPLVFVEPKNNTKAVGLMAGIVF